MTTIVYRNGVMASDSLGVANGGKLPGVNRKIWRLSDRTLVGGAGTAASLLTAIGHASSIKEIKPFSDYDSQNGLLAVTASGEVRVGEKGAWISFGAADFHAIGSGANAALGALYAGASAEEAIKAAAKVDLYTDDRVQLLTFDGPPVMPICEPLSMSVVAKPTHHKWWQRIGKRLRP